MKRLFFLIVLVMLVSWILVSRRTGVSRPASQPRHGHKQIYARENAGEMARRRALESRQQTRRALEEAREALAEAKDEVRQALGDARADVRAAFDEVRVALVSDDDPPHARRSDSAPKATACEEVDGLPVPIVPGTRVTEAKVTPPIRPQPPVKVHAQSPPVPPNPPSPRAPALAAATVAASASVPQTVTGRLSATQERAVADARHQLRDRMASWLDPEVPASWSPPARMLDAMILGEPLVKSIQKDYGEMFEATLTVDASPQRRTALIEAYNRQLVERRLASLGGALAFILICLAAVSGYIRADEATKGYYTNRLRMLVCRRRRSVRRDHLPHGGLIAWLTGPSRCMKVRLGSIRKLRTRRGPSQPDCARVTAARSSCFRFIALYRSRYYFAVHVLMGKDGEDRQTAPAMGTIGRGN